MSTQPDPSAEELLQTIVGEQLSSVEFVQDYVQLRFDGPILTAVTQPVVEANGQEFHWGQCGFRDELCKRIARKVISAHIAPEDSVCIKFDDGATVMISLRSQDYRAAEAVIFDAKPFGWWVL